jgi:hypothetical protein
MFTNSEIDQILILLKNYYNDVEYIYSLYDTSYSNRPVNPNSINIIISDNIKINKIKGLLGVNNYNITKECCYGIGEVIVITKQ